MDNQVDNVIIAEFSNEIQELLMDFNKMRNWYNHIPESLLITEQDLIKQGKAYEQRHNPIELYLYHDVTYEYFNDLYNKNIEFYKVARELIHAAKIDYSYLIGESITVERKYLDDPIRINQLDIAKKSAKVQGIKVTNNKIIILYSRQFSINRSSLIFCVSGIAEIQKQNSKCREGRSLFYKLY
ncbi:hypothetical protein SD457_22135 [Coprobacillaceae bacterium CR2/5/TPMF4]|nr:hypothetical protein SD457_22135 [Coprobacillaceae bacterium CR2/5/TPMF4]